ncbi:MAG: hypothetical protein O6943_10025 [Bacteroidetes bacterium]|nr:hypothetical protein [Bacteroidota bacterium]
MSWIFGFVSKNSFDTKCVSEFHPQSIASVSNSKYYIAIGGNNHTLFYEKADPIINYFVCGLPISKSVTKFLDKNDWSRILNDKQDELKSLNGHFCGVLTKNGIITLFTDRLGLREFHIYETGNGWYFSSRLDFILKLQGFEIDFNEFGSRWRLINQLSNKSIVKNIHRLNCGAKAIISHNQLEFIENNWFPSKGETISKNDFNHKLEKLTLLGTYNNSKISLSLSGGMDSRVILSLLLNSNYDNWDCHTFQTEDKMDINIAEKILRDFNIQHKLFSDNTHKNNNIIPELFNYIGSTYLTDSGFTSRKLMHYKSLLPNEIIIDGGFGEIWRREFLTRLYHLGKNDLENKNYENISKYLINHRANIFSEECNSLMERGIVDQIEKLVTNLPSIKEIGLGNWLDLFSLKTRLVNYYAPEQARIDNFVTAYMPFVQFIIVKDLLNLPIEKRKNNRLFKSIIKLNYSKLSKYRLAKGNISYPFYFTPLMKRASLLIHSKISNNKEWGELDSFLYKMKEFTMDSLLSNSTKEYAPYDYGRIYKKVTSYYNGEKDNKQFVNWFLTFDIFRQIMESKS